MGGSAVHTKISGVADLEVARRRRVPRDGARVPVVLPDAQHGAAAGRERDDPGRSTRRGALRHRAHGPATGLRHAQGHRARWSTTATFFEMKPAWARNLVTGLRAAWVGSRSDRRQPADGAGRRARRERGRQGGAVRVAVRRVRHPARVPPRRARASSSAPRSRSRASSATAPRCCSPSSRGDRAEGLDRDAQELRRRLLRDERHRLRSRLHRDLADRRDRGDGPRRHGRHHPTQAPRPVHRAQGARRGQGRAWPRSSARTSIPYIAAGHAQVDDVIDPADTRLAIWKGLQVSSTKHLDRPWRKHGVFPV